MTSSKEIVIAVIGGGASGVLATLHLLSSGQPLTVHLLNDGYKLGGGIAYSVSGDSLLLNVAASCMSAWSQRPTDFYQWLETHYTGRFEETSFVPRRIYREYLQSSLISVERSMAPGRLQVHRKWVNQILPKKRGFLIQAGDEQDIFADVVVLAMGNCLARDAEKRGPVTVHDNRYMPHFWKPTADSHPGDIEQDVLILGSGLTAVDIILQLRQRKHRGKIHVLSRRGQLPYAHATYLRREHFEMPQVVNLRPRHLLRAVRKATRKITIQGGDWRQVVDALRPITNAIWAQWSPSERAQFLRHVRPYWDSRRHRMAPNVAERLQKEISAGSAQLLKGRLASIASENGRLRIAYRARGSSRIETIFVGQIINCTGSEVVSPAEAQSLIEKLLELDLAKLDCHLPGLATNDLGELLDVTGRPIPNLFTIGPLRRGTLWETTAVPEIRAQAERLTQDVLAHLSDLEQRPETSSLLHEVC